MYCGLIKFGRVNLIDIVLVKVSQHIIINIDAFGDFKVILFFLSAQCERKNEQCE